MGRGLRLTLASLAVGLLATAISASGGSAHAAAPAKACLAGTAAKQGRSSGTRRAIRWPPTTRGLIKQYLADVAHDSCQDINVFSPLGLLGE